MDSGRQLGEAAHCRGKVFQLDLGLATHHADHAHHAATHVVGLRVEGMLDANTHCRFDSVAALALLGQRLAALAPAMNVAFQLLGAQLALHCLGPIGGFHPDVRANVALPQQVNHTQAVMHGCVSDVIAPYLLVLAVHIHIVLVKIMGLAMLARRENNSSDCTLMLLAPARPSPSGSAWPARPAISRIPRRS